MLKRLFFITILATYGSATLGADGDAAAVAAAFQKRSQLSAQRGVLKTEMDQLDSSMQKLAASNRRALMSLTQSYLDSGTQYGACYIEKAWREHSEVNGEMLFIRFKNIDKFRFGTVSVSLDSFKMDSDAKQNYIRAGENVLNTITLGLDQNNKVTYLKLWGSGLNDNRESFCMFDTPISN